MGGVISSPVDESTKNEIEDLVKSILLTFTTEYTIAYGLALVELIKKEVNSTPKEKWELESRPRSKQEFKSGWLIKQGGVRKNWKRRFFVVRPNYTIDYYESEEEAKKEGGKKKGTICPAGYWLNEDPNSSKLDKAIKVAEQLGVDTSNVPKPKQYPPNTFELSHSRRRNWYIQCEDQDSFREWVTEFRRAAWYARGLREEFCHLRAFPEAVRKTRWNLGWWGWYSYGGNEEQILSELIADQIDYAVMGRIYGKITGPYAMRIKIREQVLKGINSLIYGAVKPALAAMDKAVEELRSKGEPIIRQQVEPIFEQEKSLKNKIQDSAWNKIEPAMEQHVTPHLGKVMTAVKAPLHDGFQECFKLWSEHVGKFKLKDDPAQVQQDFRDLDWFAYTWRLSPAKDKMEGLREPLEHLRVIFPEIWPSECIWRGRELMEQLTDNAIYTFEQKVLAGMKDKSSDKETILAIAKSETLEAFHHDAHKATRKYYCDMLHFIVGGPFCKIVIPTCKTIVDPLSDVIPGLIKQFINPAKILEEILFNVVDRSVVTVVTADE